jgi:hypothetical protein
MNERAADSAGLSCEAAAGRASMNDGACAPLACHYESNMTMTMPQIVSSVLPTAYVTV